MQRFLVLLFSLLFVLQSSCVSKSRGYSLEKREELCLEVFFRYLFEKTPAGYVFFGEKPICLCSFLNSEDSFPGSLEHEAGIILERGAEVLAKLQFDRSSLKIIYREGSFNSHPEILIANIPTLKKVISENLVLFQATFGSNIDVDSFIEDYLFSHRFLEVLKGHEALQGILLGYGTKNALTFEKVNHLKKEALESAATKPPYKKLEHPKSERDMLDCIRKVSGQNQSDILQLLDDFTYCSAQTLENPNLKIPFCFHEQSEESKNLIQKYALAQKRLEKNLKREDFLAVVLKRLEK